LWAFLSIALASVFKRVRRELPYGPHLAVATLVVMLCRPGIHAQWNRFMPNVPWPNPTYVPSRSPLRLTAPLRPKAQPPASSRPALPQAAS
jgi:hypothetical protein